MPARVLTLALSATLLAGCASGSSPKASPSPSPTPSPTPTLPPVATDTASLKASLVTAADVGAPWVTPKGGKVNRTNTAKGDLCPGHKDVFARVPGRASAEVNMTEGTKQGAAIGSYQLVAYDPAKIDAWRAAFTAANAECKAFVSPEKLWVTTETLAEPSTLDGCDEVLARIQRVYADRTRKTLYYVRQVVQCRVGRVVVEFEHAFIQPKTDPTGADFAKTVTLTAKQVAKLSANFGQ